MVSGKGAINFMFLHGGHGTLLFRMWNLQNERDWRLTAEVSFNGTMMNLMTKSPSAVYKPRYLYVSELTSKHHTFLGAYKESQGELEFSIFNRSEIMKVPLSNHYSI